MIRLLGHLSRAIASLLPGALENESVCGRLARSFGADSWICRLLDALVGEPGHCRAEAEWLRKK